MKANPQDHPIDALEQAAPIPPVLQENSDQAFFIRFGIVLALLMGLAGVFWLVAKLASGSPDDAGAVHELVDERTRPLGQVATSAEAAAALAGTTQAAPAAVEISGQQAVDQYCGACHNAGLLGAPKHGDAAAWKQREAAAGGVDGLLASAIKGKGQMPPRGGVAGLSDQSLREAIDILRK